MPGHPGEDFTNGQGRGTTGYRRRFFHVEGATTVAQARLSMRKIREILRLKAEAGLSCHLSA